MATKFYKRTTPSYTILANATYSDLFDNNQATVDIQSGTVDNRQNTTLFLCDYNIAPAPTYGGGELKGAKIGLYINTITSGQSGGSAGLKAFALNNKIGDREGGKDEVGSIITNQSIAQFCAYHANDTYNIKEDFSGAATDETEYETKDGTVVQHLGPYLDEDDGWYFGRHFGAARFRGWNVDKARHHRRYGQTLEDGTKIYKIKRADIGANEYWKSVKVSKQWWRRNTEVWEGDDINRSDYYAQNYTDNRTRIKYTHEITVEIPPEDQTQLINETNSTFSKVKQSAIFRGTAFDATTTTTNFKREAFGEIVFSSKNVRTGGYSMHLNSLYMHRNNSSSTPWYPIQYNPSLGDEQTKTISSGSGTATLVLNNVTNLSVGMYVRLTTGATVSKINSINVGTTTVVLSSEYTGTSITFSPNLPYSPLHQVSFASKMLPLPIEIGNSNSKKKDSSGGHSPVPTIDIDMNFETLAPMLVRFENGDGTQSTGSTKTGSLGGARTAHDPDDDDALDTGAPWRFRLNRSIVITFGEEAPESKDTLYSYIKKHAPSCGTAGETEASSANTYPTWTKAGSAQTMSVTGDGVNATAKSFFGTAFVNYDGELGYYDLTSSATSIATSADTTHDDLTFRADDNLGEIAFVNAPTTIDGELFGSWLRMAFQVDPEMCGAFHAIYDSSSGDVHRTPQPLRNIKPMGSGTTALKQLRVPNRDDWPKHMTIWQNNYQAIKGPYNHSHDAYTTGLVHGVEQKSGTYGGDGRVNLRLIAGTTDATNELEGAQLSSVPYNLITPGTSVRTSTSTTGVSSEIGVTGRQTTKSKEGWLVMNVDQNKDCESGEPLLYDPLYPVDSQVKKGKEDMSISVFVDAISLKNFNILHKNATPAHLNKVPARLEIPTANETVPFGFSLEGSWETAIDNVYEDRAYSNSYLCFGFDDYTDMGFALNVDDDSSDINLLMSGFSTANTPVTDKIITNTDSVASHVRAGYSSSAEDYGMQNRIKLTQSYAGSTGTQDSAGGSGGFAGYHSTGITNQSPFFDNNAGTPDYDARGLKVGNDTDGFELSIGSDTSRQIDRFTQKGILTMNFGIRRENSGELLTAAVDISPSTTTIPVDDGAAFSVNQYISIVNEAGSSVYETMKITSISSDNLTVERAVYGTTIGSHADNAAVAYTAVPEKRECLFTSARVTNVTDSKTISVDDASIFLLEENTEFILYKHNDSHSAPTYSPRTLSVTRITDNEVKFDTPHNLKMDNTDILDKLISPKKYWVVLEMTNIGGEITKTRTDSGNDASHVYTDVDGLSVGMYVQGTSTKINTITDATNTVALSAAVSTSTVTFESVAIIADDENKTKTFLPEVAYDNVVGITTDDITLGATFKESLFNDGADINVWNLEAFEADSRGLVSLKDYGFGEFDEKLVSGGHAGYLPLNKQNDINKYKEIDVSGAITTDSVEPSSTFPIMISSDDPAESFKYNIDTEIGTNPTYLISVFEDELMEKPPLTVLPDKDNAFYPNFKWNTPDKDAWYGFIMVDDKNIYNQYNNAVIHLPLNESGPHGTTASAPTEKISGISTHISGPLYNVEGLAGYALDFDGSNDYIKCGTPTGGNFGGAGTNDPRCAATTEMSVVTHFVPNSGGADDRYVIAQEETGGRKFSIKINSSNNIIARVYRAEDSHVELTSSSIIPADGETPSNVILTVDTTLPSSNVKLYVNGKLEDTTGAALATGTTNNWQKDATMQSANGYIVIGNSSHSAETLDSSFDGKIEEIVIYDKCIYPVASTDSEFTLRKPLSELASGHSLAQSKSFTAKIFMKDYHNIRGKTEEEVASSSQVSWRKAAFALDTS